MTLRPWEDPDHPGNSKEWQTHLKCIEPGCELLGGTVWGPLWCFKHNKVRMARIDKSMKAIARAIGIDDDAGD